MTTYHLKNIYKLSQLDNPVKISRVINGKKWNTYKLERSIRIQLSNGRIINIKKGFTWDLSSVPRIFWTLLPPDGNFIIAALIHDYLYKKWKHWFWIRKLSDPRKFADLEMLKWSRAMNGTRKISLKKIDNYTRYYGVRLFGKHAWEN